MNRKTVIIVSAMLEEIEPLRLSLSNSDNVSISVNEDLLNIKIDNMVFYTEEYRIVTISTGIGKINATKVLLNTILEYKNDLDHILNIGSCCAISDIEVGTLVQPYRILDVENPFNPIKELNVDKSLYLKYHVISVITGTGDFLIDSQEIKQSLSEHINTFDMETYAYYSICEDLDIPFKSIRFVSDTGDNFNDVFEHNITKYSLELSKIILELYN